MQNDLLKNILLELENIYKELKANKDKRLIKPLIIKIKEALNNGK